MSEWLSEIGEPEDDEEDEKPELVKLDGYSLCLDRRNDMPYRFRLDEKKSARHGSGGMFLRDIRLTEEAASEVIVKLLRLMDEDDGVPEEVVEAFVEHSGISAQSEDDEKKVVEGEFRFEVTDVS